MSSTISNIIKARETPADVFYTPKLLVEEIMNLIDFKKDEKVLDGFHGKGVFFDNYPDHVEKDFCEIEVGVDFFEYSGETDWCVSNPPYSILNKVLEKTCGLVKVGFGYLLHFHALTHSRLRKLEERGFYLRKLHICKVDKWYGHQAFVVFTKIKGDCKVSYSKKVFKED